MDDRARSLSHRLSIFHGKCYAHRKCYTVCAVVGPHGDYRSMLFLLNRGKNSAMGHVRGPSDRLSELLDVLDKASGLIADVLFTPEESAEDRFCRVLRATKMLTAVYHWKCEAECSEEIECSKNEAPSLSTV